MITTHSFEAIASQPEICAHLCGVPSDQHAPACPKGCGFALEPSHRCARCHACARQVAVNALGQLGTHAGSGKDRLFCRAAFTQAEGLRS